MPLHAHAVDADAGLLQHLDHAHDAIALGRPPGVEVVVVELCVGRIALREGERIAHHGVAIADALHPVGGAVAAVLVDDLVDHVPGLHLAHVAAGHARDVRAHAFQLGLRRIRFAVCIDKEPLRRLVMPDQRMANDEHATPLPVGDKGIGRGEIEHARLRRHHLGLHHVLGGHRVEVAANQRCGGRILARDDVRIDRGADQKAACIRVLERRGARCAGRRGDGRDGHAEQAQQHCTSKGEWAKQVHAVIPGRDAVTAGAVARALGHGRLCN